MIDIKKILIVLLLIFLVPIKTSNASSAETYCVMEIESGRVLLEKNKDKRKLTASISKIMTVLVAIIHGDLDKEVVITEKDASQLGSSSYIRIGEKVKLRDLLYVLNLRSGNDVAHAIALAVSSSIEEFAYLMNETAKEIGMINSTFENPSGLDEENYNYSTAYDMALLTSYAYQFDEFVEIFESKSHTLEGYHFVSKHRLVRLGGIYLGGKTGYTKKANRTLVTTAEKNFKAVVVTLNDSNDWNTHNELFNYVFSNYSLYTLYESGPIKQDFIELEYIPNLKKDIIIPLSKDELDNIKCVVHLRESLSEDAGMIEIRLNKQSIKYRLYPYYVGMVND